MALEMRIALELRDQRGAPGRFGKGSVQRDDFWPYGLNGFERLERVRIREYGDG